ncbi:MAG TPA: PSD1 and planctomycete cytochrome C domain-containing protein [Pirellulales bacterium]|nr:PSD1 and planctomycete cytochrome C domain-containing protein [Pirellulales bacterium]
MSALRRSGWPTVLAALLASIGWAAADEPMPDAPGLDGPFPAEQIDFFEKQVRPLLVEHCHQCHGERAQKGNLRLDSRAAVLQGGDTGPALVPGKPAESLLVDAIGYGDLYQMPPLGKLAEKQIAVLRRWVELGAPWPQEAPPSASGKQADPRAAFDLAERAKHWAFQPLDLQPPPVVSDQAWPKSTTDLYILSRLEGADLVPAAPAERRTLLRRVTFDLIGLPPTPAEIDAFLADERADAFERVIDRLLASPHFGERWARHWLDLVRYAESKGHEFDYTIPNAWHYRDYVIRALNADVPYDRFVTEHVAGDLLDEPRRHPEKGFNESVLATGFLFLGEEIHSPVELPADECDRTDNKIDVFSKTFLGLTVACARCHDHKFDAISTKDYYGLAGYLLSGSYRQVPFDSLDQEREIAARLCSLQAEHRSQLLTALHTALRPTLDRLADLLLATRDVLAQAGTDDDPARATAIISVAAARRIDTPELTRWLESIRQAIADPTSPLHLWALAAAARDQNGAGPPHIRSAADALQRPPAAGGETRILVDFQNLPPQDWRQDGFVFGLAPAKVGHVSLGTSVERPIARIWSRPAAVSDPFWDGATLAAGVEREAGRLGWLQSGRLLRTPTFTLGTGKLRYLVSGSGYAYAAVHSHRMNNGPLHGALVREWQAGERFQWIEHDLSAYVGQRVHIEFSPRQAGDVKGDASPRLAIGQVIEGEAPVDPGPLATLAFGDSDLSSYEALAAAYQRRLTHAAEQLAADALTNAGDAALADWLAQNVSLFAPAESAARHSLTAATQPWIEAQARLAAELPRQVHTAPAMLDGSGVDQCVLLRGNPKTPGERVARRYLEALGGTQHEAANDGSGRLELARQMTDPANPLVARVLVNRVWQHLFGRGIVASVDNFGVLGEAPTHRELLDRLADDFVRDGWSIKRLIRRLLLTSSYQLSSRPSEPARRLDPNNLLLSHAAVKRLEAEAIRDSLLAVSGRLDGQLFGPSMPIYLSEFMEGRGRPPSGPVDGDGRRSVYLSVRRNFLSTFFLAFDYPVPFSAVGRRSVSNVPAQALTLMNSPLVAGAARRWAERSLTETNDVTVRIGQLYLTALGRPPSNLEIRQAEEFLVDQARGYGQPGDERAWADLCHVLLNTKEFIFVD